MFDWLFEGLQSVYLLLAGLAVVLLVLWWRTRKRWLLAGVAIVGVLIGLYALLDRAVESDREQITRKVVEMIDAVNKRDLDTVFKHVSDEFRSPSGKSKAELRSFAQQHLNSGEVEKVIVWDIVCDEDPSREKGSTRVFFRVKAIGIREMLADCDAVFDFDPKMGWRLRAIRLLKPQTTEEWTIQL